MTIKLHTYRHKKKWRHLDITIKQIVSSSTAQMSLIIIRATKTFPTPGAETSPSHVKL